MIVSSLSLDRISSGAALCVSIGVTGLLIKHQIMLYVELSVNLIISCSFFYLNYIVRMQQIHLCIYALNYNVEFIFDMLKCNFSGDGFGEGGVHMHAHCILQ